MAVKDFVEGTIVEVDLGIPSLALFLTIFPFFLSLRFALFLLPLPLFPSPLLPHLLSPLFTSSSAPFLMPATIAGIKPHNSLLLPLPLLAPLTLPSSSSSPHAQLLPSSRPTSHTRLCCRRHALQRRAAKLLLRMPLLRLLLHHRGAGFCLHFRLQ